jgi:5-methylcytosine-specific restriction endonuclease McrA
MAYKTPDLRRTAYLKTRDKALEQAAQRYKENPEKYLEYQREYRKANAELIRNRTRAKRKERLQLAIDLLGGRCKRCEGVFDMCQYDFHHINPKEKEFTIGENVLVSEERFINEVKKCELLCANCHRLKHKEQYLDSPEV